MRELYDFKMDVNNIELGERISIVDFAYMVNSMPRTLFSGRIKDMKKFNIDCLHYLTSTLRQITLDPCIYPEYKHHFMVASKTAAQGVCDIMNRDADVINIIQNDNIVLAMDLLKDHGPVEYSELVDRIIYDIYIYNKGGKSQ